MWIYPNPDSLVVRLRDHVERLASQPRPPESQAHLRARKFLRNSFEDAGFSVQEEAETGSGLRWINVATHPLPSDSKLPILVVGAHYDSTAHTPGADDNASAVAALVELARWFGPRLKNAATPFKARVLLVGYDLEELGVVGSSAHAARIFRDKLPLLGMISLEMLGYTDSRPGSQNLPEILRPYFPNIGDFIGLVGNRSASRLIQELHQGMRAIPNLPSEFLSLPDDTGHSLPETRLSDHSPFWDHGYPAVMVTDTSFLRNPHYHRSTDTPDTLDYPFLARVTCGLICGISSLIGLSA